MEKQFIIIYYKDMNTIDKLGEVFIIPKESNDYDFKIIKDIVKQDLKTISKEKLEELQKLRSDYFLKLFREGYDYNQGVSLIEEEIKKIMNKNILNLSISSVLFKLEFERKALDNAMNIYIKNKD